MINTDKEAVSNNNPMSKKSSNKSGIYLLLCVIVSIVVYLLLPDKYGDRKIDSKEMITIEGLAQGSFYRISYFEDCNSLPCAANLKINIDSILKEFDLCASLWVDSSLICMVNRNEHTELSPMFIDLFNKSQEISLFTNGYFDITVGPLVNAYGFARKEGKKSILSEQEERELLKLVGFTKVKIEGKQLVKENNKAQIDFNAVAQGYCADLVSAYLEDLGIKRFLVDIGGEMCLKGKKNDGKDWNIAIEKPCPQSQSTREIYKTLPITNCAVVTSGNYRKYFEVDGKRYSHSINPITGKPAMDSLLSATVICSESWRADAMATAFMVMGFEKSKDFLNQHPQLFKVFLIYSQHNGEFNIWEN